MKDDTKQALERLEKELLQEESAEDILGEALMKDIFSEPAFEDTDTIGQLEDPEVYCNFSNGYGMDIQEEPKKDTSKVDIGLMITVSVLCLGIIGVMTYWLVRFL